MLVFVSAVFAQEYVQITMSSRGGVRHTAKPYVDPGLLFRILAAHQGLVKDLGPYEVISRTGGVDPSGLVKALDLFEGLVQIAPGAEIHPHEGSFAAAPCRNPYPQRYQVQWAGVGSVEM